MSETLSITLPAALAEMVRAKVASGDYANVSEVVEDSLLSLQDRDVALEDGLLTEVVAAYDAHMADPAQAIPIEDVIARFEARFAAAAKTGNRVP